MAEAGDVVMAENDSKKRPLPDDAQHMSTPATSQPVRSVESSESFPTPPLSANSENGSPLQSKDPQRHPSPALSTSTLSSLATSTLETPSLPPGAQTSGTPRPTKRRKLTVTEKEQQKREKEAKEKERAEKRAKREEERTQKDEEKRLKDEERRRKNEEKEAKQREKDLDKQRKEEDKAKKERAQMRLNAFFAKPAVPKASVPTASAEPPVSGRDRRSSRSPEPEKATVELQSVSKSPEKQVQPPAQSDYERTFLPFALGSHTTCAPHIYFSRANEEAESSQGRLDELLQQASDRRVSPAETPPKLRSYFTNKNSGSRGIWQPNVREVIESLHGSSDENPIDLTEDRGHQHKPEDLLDLVFIRHLHFAEDVRPPYHGSYSKISSPRDSARLRRNPFSRVRKDTDYDYDSEAEWEEPEEGEDIGSDGEDDAESVDGADEMDDFLDDEDQMDARRKLITGDLKPVSTGLCWEDASGKIGPFTSETSADLKSMRIEFLLEKPVKSIDPFSASYWDVEPVPAPQSAEHTPLKTQDGFFKPRLPLQALPSKSNEPQIVGAASGMNGPIMAVAGAKAPKAPPKKLSTEDLVEFKEAVTGSNLTKIELLKALKKRFPKWTNESIKDTLSNHAARVGASAAEKRWVFIDAA